MLRASVALLCFKVAQSAEAPACSENDSCKRVEVDTSSMLQLGRLGAQGGATLQSDALVLSEASGSSNISASYTPLYINEDGVMNKYYLTGMQSGATIIDDGMTVEYTPPYRFYLMKNPTNDFSKAENFYKPDFMGKVFTVDVDFKKDGPGCGCNLNFYLVDMPWPTKGDEGDYYCDAQCFDGKGCCPEFDMNEGNKETQQVTNHACTGKGTYTQDPTWECNKWGDPELKTKRRQYGPGHGHEIDSDKPFQWQQTFERNGDDFIFTTVMSQEGRDVELKMGPGNAQLNDMANDIEKGMVFVTGYWYAPDMNWLDGETCGAGEEHCNKHPAYISNWRITTIGSPVPGTDREPATPPPPASAPATPAEADGEPAEADSEPTIEPIGGRCCFQGCGSSCVDSSHYCSSDEQTCKACNGKFCQ